METKVITCRTHGGNFRVPVKRGRPPVNCTPENKCKAPRLVPEDNGRNPAKRNALQLIRDEKRERDAKRNELAAKAQQPPAKPAESPAAARTAEPRGITKGKQAKAQLEALGWAVEGRATDVVTLTAIRGVELLVITWDRATGDLLAQDYSLWDTSVGTGRNGKPDHRLPFDPEEIPDAELVRELGGMKVTWWNSLAKAETTDVIQAGTIKIEHSYESNGDEVYGDRIVKFVGYGGGGFRAFRLAALLKVG